LPKKVKEQKRLAVEELTGLFSGVTAAVITDYRGITTAELTGLRRKLREAGVSYRVVKNTLARRAADSAGREAVKGLFEGPVALALGTGEVNVPAKVLLDFIGSTKSNLLVKGGFIGDRLLTAKEVASLARLPSRNELLSKLLGQLQAPITGLVTVLSGPVRNLAGVLQARISQLEAK